MDHFDVSFRENCGEIGLCMVIFTVGRSKSTGRSVVKNRPRPTDFDRPRTLQGTFSTKYAILIRDFFDLIV